jgi:GNAT superfamily N-acetyltransferase
MGYGVVRRESRPDGGLLGVIEDIYVDPGARAVGLGEALMDHLLRWCRDQGCFGVDSLALPGDRATKNFFESFGLVARAIVVHRPLDG